VPVQHNFSKFCYNQPTCIDVQDDLYDDGKKFLGGKALFKFKFNFTFT
jgi:hypothetical protein